MAGAERDADEPGEEPPRGFVLVQIDALGWRTLLEAIRRRRAPGVRRLLRDRHSERGHRVSPLRPGVPATTPTVQAELLYGAPRRFPGFRFLSRKSGATVYFGNAFDVGRIERNEFKGSFGILQNSGSSYFNIFAGSADTARFSTSEVASAAGWRRLVSRTRQLRHLAWAWLVSLPGIVWRFFLELALEAFDVVRSYIRKEIHRGHFSFVLRGIVNSAMGEFTVAAIREELRAGTRHVYVNFIGYDKAAHLRGPEHPYALWTLRQIDRGVRRIAREARRSKRCAYDFYLMSDHGMAPSRPITDDAGVHFEQWLDDELRGLSYGGPRLAVRATGNLAHVYADRTPEPLPHEELVARLPMLERLLEDCRYVGWWASLDAGGCLLVRRYGRDLRFSPEEQHAELTGQSGLDPRLVDDLFRLLRNPDSGDLVLFGAREDGLVWNFLEEYGCHGGDEPEEQDAFVVHPRWFNVGGRELRPLDLFRHFRDTYHAAGEAAAD